MMVSGVVDPLPLNDYGVEHWGWGHVEWVMINQLTRLI